MNTISLPSYNIKIGDIQTALSQYLENKEYSQTAMLVDDNTRRDCLPLLEEVTESFQIIEIPQGESYKTLETCESIWSRMVEHGLDRHSLMINLGGGVIGDMGGYAASCYMRGIDFVQIPTTLLSQVDASVGGKIGVDFQGLKNFIGLFKDPKAVLVDPTFLKTLAPAELKSGYAEMLKHGLIQDATIWNRLIENNPWDSAPWAGEIYDSIQVKKNVVQEDPFEKGPRKILNFGHTIGHAVETISFSTSSPLLHGEAIAIGMMAETILSVKKCGLNPTAADQIITYLKKVYDNPDLSILEREEEIISILTRDKKNNKGRRLFSLLSDIGKCEYDIEVKKEEIIKCLNVMRK